MLALFLGLWLLPAAVEANVLTGKVIAIADGDTITVLDAEKTQHKIRLQGIDAPEKGQVFGTVARKALGDKVDAKSVRVTWKEKDRYGRIIGEVYLGERHINQEMVEDGLAWWYRKYAPKDRELEAGEKKAQDKKRGLWRDKAPVPPWEWRKLKRELH